MENGRLKDRQKAERQIGRLQERNSRSASLFTVTVTETGAGEEKRLKMDIWKNEGLLSRPKIIENVVQQNALFKA
jgi:hypothetical protein